MHTMTGWGIAVAGAMALTGLAFAVRARVCKPMADGVPPEQVTLWSLAGLMVPAAVVLLLTAPIVGMAHWHPGFGTWLDVNVDYLRAWYAFWWLVLLIEACEFALRLVFVLRGRPFQIPMLVRNIVFGALVIAALLGVAQEVLGYDISTVLASTALLTAVAGFALQGVLGNLMSGISMHIARSIMPGDWVAIDEIEGEIIATNWRETRLRTVAGHILILPNSKVSEAVVHNMSRPTPLRRVTIDVGASYADAPVDVMDAMVTAALSVPGVLREPPPQAVQTEFQDYGINYALRFWTDRYGHRVLISSEVQTRIWYQFKRRNIEIPFPMSDKLLADFMEVVYQQRTMPPKDVQLERNLDDLLRSDFYRTWLVGGDGRPLVTDEELRPVVGAMRRQLYTRGETLFAQGDPGGAAYVVLRGTLEGRIDFDDRVASHRFVIDLGALVGEMSLVTGMPRNATLTASTEVEALEIPKVAFVELLKVRADIPTKLAALVAQRAADNAARYAELKAQPPVGLAEALQQETLLRRFMRLLGR